MVFGFVLIFVLIHHQQPGNNSSVKVPVSPTAQYYPYLSVITVHHDCHHHRWQTWHQGTDKNPCACGGIGTPEGDRWVTGFWTSSMEGGWERVRAYKGCVCQDIGRDVWRISITYDYDVYFHHLLFQVSSFKFQLSTTILIIWFLIC